MEQRRRRGLRLVAALVVLAGVGAGLFFLLRPGKAEAPAVATAAVTRGSLQSVVTATGTVSARVTVQVGSQVSGRIQELHADFNSQVKKGQVVARIDPSLFKSEVAQARANLSSARAAVKGAEASLAEARRSYERSSSLAAKKLVSQADADSALAKVQTAEAQLASDHAKLEQARAALDRSETNFAYTTIVSPIDGVVISRSVDVGQTVAASLQAPTLFTIAEDLRKMEVHTSVAEADVGQLRPGMKAEFTVDAYPSDRFEAEVKEVRYSPTTVQNVVTYDAVVSVENPELKLRPGMTADVSFVVERVDDALLVPNAALRYRPPENLLPGKPQGAPGGKPDGAGAARPAAASSEKPGAAAPDGVARNPGHRAVWKLGADGRPQRVRVEVGISDGRNTAVKGEGLAEGDQVITGSGGASAAGGDSSSKRNQMRPPGRFL